VCFILKSINKLKKMEKTKLIIYWVATVSMALGMFGSGLSQVFMVKGMADIVGHVGYPLYFMRILGIWKILGVIVILLPGFKLVKEWAYAGLFFAMTGAVISHLAVGDGLDVAPLMQAVFVVLSWYLRPVSRKFALN
jgi:hypothetical protein